MGLIFTRNTDKKHVVKLFPRLISARWISAVAVGGEHALCEVFTSFVGDGAPIIVKGKSQYGERLGKIERNIFGNHFRGTFHIPENIDPNDEVYFEVELPKNGISRESDRITAMPPIQVTELKWGKSMVRPGDTVILSAIIRGLPEKTEVYLTAYECDGSGHCEKVARLPAFIQQERAQVNWEFDYYKDTGDIPTDGQLKKYGRSYAPPRYFFTVTYFDVEYGKEPGEKPRSGFLDFRDWIQIQCLYEHDKPLPAFDYTLTFADDSKRKGSVDEFGEVAEEDIPPGPCQFLYDTSDQSIMDKPAEDILMEGDERTYWLSELQQGVRLVTGQRHILKVGDCQTQSLKGVFSCRCLRSQADSPEYHRILFAIRAVFSGFRDFFSHQPAWDRANMAMAHYLDGSGDFVEIPPEKAEQVQNNWEKEHQKTARSKFAENMKSKFADKVLREFEFKEWPKRAPLKMDYANSHEPPLLEKLMRIQHMTDSTERSEALADVIEYYGEKIRSDVSLQFEMKTKEKGEVRYGVTITAWKSYLYDNYDWDKDDIILPWRPALLQRLEQVVEDTVGFAPPFDKICTKILTFPMIRSLAAAGCAKAYKRSSLAWSVNARNMHLADIVYGGWREEIIVVDRKGSTPPKVRTYISPTDDARWHAELRARIERDRDEKWEQESKKGALPAPDDAETEITRSKQKDASYHGTVEDVIGYSKDSKIEHSCRSRPDIPEKTKQQIKYAVDKALEWLLP